LAAAGHAAHAHEWHRQDTGTGPRASDAVFAIPAEAGPAPGDSCARAAAKLSRTIELDGERAARLFFCLCALLPRIASLSCTNQGTP
ncbi:MAG: hypothetical protein VCG02_14525, partial [Verrucomicrobiota bacterium]